METMVLPAQDHLANERHRYQNGVMSGTHYAPKPRRKVKPSPQFYATASLQADNARSSPSQNLQVVDTYRGKVSPLPSSPKILRHASMPSPTLQQSSAGLKKSQRSSQTSTPAVVGSVEIHASSYDLQPAAQSFKISGNRAIPSPTNLPRSTSEGKLLQVANFVRSASEGKFSQVSRKAVDVEKSDRRMSADKTVESAQNFVEKKSGEKTDRPLDRRKKSEKKAIERKVAATPSVLVGKNSTHQQKPIITILQRPQTKEAAAEHVAKFSGRTAEVCSSPAHSPKTVEVPQALGSGPAFENMQASSISIVDAQKVVHATDTLGDSVTLMNGEMEDPWLFSSIYMGQVGSDDAHQKYRGELALTLSKMAGPTEIGSKESFDGGLGLLGGFGQILIQSPEKSSERWAGPAYTNSPPPNTLPFPTFPVQRVKSCTADVSIADGTLSGPMDKKSQIDVSLFSTWIVQPQIMDPSSATKDLRRMLNIDSDWTDTDWSSSDEESSDGSKNHKEESSNSATRGLKRILQLS